MPNTYYVKYRGVVTEATLEELKAKISSGEIGKLHKVSADKKNWDYASHHLQTGFRELDPASSTLQAPAPGQAPAPAPAPSPAAPAPAAPAAEPTLAPRNQQQCPSCLTKIVIPEPNSGRIRCPTCNNIARISPDGSLSAVVDKTVDDKAAKSPAGPSRSPSRGPSRSPRGSRQQASKSNRLWISLAVAGLLLIGGSLGLAYLFSPSNPTAQETPGTNSETSSSGESSSGGGTSSGSGTSGGGGTSSGSGTSGGGGTSSGSDPVRQGGSVERTSIPRNVPPISPEQPRVIPVKGPDETLTNTLGMTLKLVPAGNFVIGSPASETHRRDNETQRNVSIRKPFYLAAHEVNHEQFSRFVNATRFKTDAETGSFPGGYIKEDGAKDTQLGRYWDDLGQLKPDPKMPVVNVTRADAEAFCKWLSVEDGAKYRLPTEAEWEYACRAGTTTANYGGDNDNDLVKIANVADKSFGQLPGESPQVMHDDRFPRLAPVGQFQPNKLGLFDMLGNVAEWCSDDVNGQALCRGGSWTLGIDDARSAARLPDDPSALYIDVGFRVLREIN